MGMSISEFVLMGLFIGEARARLSQRAGAWVEMIKRRLLDRREAVGILTPNLRFRSASI
jgi:hypothetical protein